MIKISEGFMEQLKNSCDIVSVVSSYVELKNSGRNKKCSCPFHSEKTPSFFVYEDTQSFYCFGCCVGGDVVTFIEKIENLNYLEAVKVLAKRAGLSIPGEEFDYEMENENDRARQKILKMNKVAAKFFHKNLFSQQGKEGLRYLVGRGLKKSTVIRFGLGYSQNSWDSLKKYLEFEGFGMDEMVESGLVVRSKSGNCYDRFRDRVMFPIIDLNGNVVAFGGRILKGSGPKYLNSSDSVVFKKGFGVYSLNFAKASGKKDVLLCEGYMDVISMHQNGFENAVAALGTSLTNDQVRLISRNFHGVVLAFDCDEAGSFATVRASRMFEKVGIRPRVLKFKGAKDPDEYVKKFGAGRLKIAIEGAKNIENFKLEQLKQKYDLNNLDDVKKYTGEYCEIILNVSNPLERELYVGELCKQTKISRDVVVNYVEYLLKRKKIRNERKFDDEARRLTFKKNESLVNEKVIRAEEGIIRLIYCNTSYIKRVSGVVDSEKFCSSFNGKIYDFIIKRFNSLQSLDFFAFHEILDSDEMGRFSRIVNGFKDFRNDVEELEEYLDVVLKNYEKASEDVLKLTPEQLEFRRQKRAESKR